MNFSAENKLDCRDRSEGPLSLRHIKLSATYFSQQNQSKDGPSVNLSQNSGENNDSRVRRSGSSRCCRFDYENSRDLISDLITHNSY